jgi:hypothetical protein
VSTTSTSRATPTALPPRRCNTPELALIDGGGHCIQKKINPGKVWVIRVPRKSS